MATLARTAEQRAALRRLVTDFEFYAESYLQVLDKQTLRLVPLRLKPVQRRLVRWMLERYLAGKPVRVIILKARREGVSTVVQAFFFWLAATRRHQVAATLSHHEDTTKDLFAISERYYTFLPAWLKPMRRQVRRGQVFEFANPSKDDDRVAEDPGLQSVLQVVTAKNAGAGKGASLIHVSELGLYEQNQIDAKTVLDTLLQIVPTAGETVVVLESTARGVGNEFYRRWKQAERDLKEGVDDGFFPFFIAWFEEGTNRIGGASWEALGELDEREERLRDVFGCDAGQVAWRRYAIRTLCGGDPDTFDQEYPESANVAFLSSGRPFFDQEAVSDHLEWALVQEPIVRGELVEDDDLVMVRPARRGKLVVWEAPRDGEEYLVAVDSSEGSEHGDPQHAYVFKRSALEVVAAWHGRVDRDELGDHVYLLGHLYNKALVAVETNGGWGWTVISILKRRGYPRLYRDPGQNKVKKRRSLSYGFDMSPTKRPLVLDALGQAIRDGELDCPDPDLFRECLVFVYGPSGKPAAMPGEHDDRVLSAALGAHLWVSEPRRRGDRPQPQVSTRPLVRRTGYAGAVTY